MEELIAQFKKEGMMITDAVEVAAFGKFIYAMDIVRNKIELWNRMILNFKN